MAHTFRLNRESLRREYAVYVVIVHGDNEYAFYIGKTGDNREGCNPIISRCGNHFSYNPIHSQVRNKIQDHENFEYTYVFDHFGSYSSDPDERKYKVDEINEMERWLNNEIQKLAKNMKNCQVANPYLGTGYVKKSEQLRRAKFRTEGNRKKIDGIIAAVRKLIS